MFYAYIPLFSYMGPNLGQMPAAAALRLLRLRLRLRLEIPAADRGTGYTIKIKKSKDNPLHEHITLNLSIIVTS